MEAAFDGMSVAFDGRLGRALEQIDKITGDLLDDERGELPRALAEFRHELGELLGEAFDVDSKKSVLAKFDRLQDEATKRQVAAIKRVVDPGDPESPLGRHRQEIVKVVKDVGESLARAVAEVSEKVAVSKAQAELAEKAASKGFGFEAVVHEVTSRIALESGDLAERVGAAPGATAGKSGDEIVTLSLDDTHGVSARYVLELKDRKLGMKATFEGAGARDGQPRGRGRHRGVQPAGARAYRRPVRVLGEVRDRRARQGRARRDQTRRSSLARFVRRLIVLACLNLYVR